MNDLFKCSPERLEIALSKLYRWEWDELLGEEPKDEKAWRNQRNAAISLIEEQFGSKSQSWLWWKHGLGKTFPEWAAWREEELEIMLKRSRRNAGDTLITVMGILILIAALAATLWILSRI